MAKELLLTHGKHTFVDDDDYENLHSYKWCASKRVVGNRIKWYAKRAEGTKHTHKTIYMHRQILGLPPGVHADHRDGDGLNNRKSNLRPCTRAQNIYNSIKSASATSKFKGVSWLAREKKWVSQINFCKRKIHLGLFNDEESAARAYDRRALKLFGVFAKSNFGQTGELDE